MNLKVLLQAKLRIMGDNNPTRFQDDPLKTVGGVVFTKNCYISISIYFEIGWVSHVIDLQTLSVPQNT